MANVSHLWNMTKLLMKMETSKANELRNYYIRCCQEQCNDAQLPQQIFGPTSMCSHCGSLWSAVDYKVKISKARVLSTSIKKLIRKEKKKSLTRYQHDLTRQCMKNQSNGLIITCSYCQKTTKMLLNKPARLKKVKQQHSNTTTGITPKKKRKRNKDKNAGLLINTPPTPSNTKVKEQLSTIINNENNNTPISRNKDDKLKKMNTPISRVKSKKINLSKLKGIVNATVSPTTRPSLHSFLSELG